MPNATASLRGVLHGKTVELEYAPALPDGQKVSIHIQPLEEPPKWLEQFAVDPSIAPGKLIIKGTRLLAEQLAEEADAGRTDEELLQAHPELAQERLEALRQYARVPAIQRRLFGAWAEDVEELDRFLEETRRLRRHPRRGTEE